MKDGSILSNTGHFDVEIDKPALGGLRPRRAQAREFVEEFTIDDGRRIYLVAEGRWSTSRRRGPPCPRDGHVLREPGARRRVRGAERGVLERKVYPVPDEIDREIARLKLATMGIDIDR